jgi:hypothetical protein
VDKFACEIEFSIAVNANVKSRSLGKEIAECIPK